MKLPRELGPIHFVGIGGIGRDYGDGAAIKILFDALSTVKFPTFL